MSSKIQGVHHIAVKPAAEQYQKTVDFYTRLLGMEVVSKWGDPERPCLMVSCGDNSCMEILPQKPGFTCPETGPLCHIAFVTDKVDEIVEAVRKEGYEVKAEPQDGNLDGKNIRNAFFYGPIREEIELFWVK